MAVPSARGVTARDDVRSRFERFAAVEARGSSPAYEALALAVSRDDAALDLLAELPAAKRQPNLLFGVLRWHGVPVDDPPAALAWVRRNRTTVLDEVNARRTQTNEVGRCALLLPALARVEPEPLALVEVGASAGLCLLFDAWRYRYTGPGRDHVVGRRSVTGPVLECAVEGDVPLPERVPEIAWRVGLDLNPLDPARPEVRRWLECLVWPEHRERARTLRAALAVACRTGVRVEAGDLVDDLPDLLRRVPRGLTPVVLHSAALVYLDEARRRTFVELVGELGALRIGLEAAHVLPGVSDRLPAGADASGRFVLTLDDDPLALADPHGGRLTWL
mgnify:CR=1 FL=1